MRRTRLHARAALLGPVVAAALALGGCSLFDDGPEPVPVETAEPTTGISPTPPSEPGAPSSSPVAAPDLSRFYRQRLTWSSCRDGFRCAELEVPLDYAHPERRSIAISLLKSPAEDRDERLGSLLVNPGGPGVSGVDFAVSAASYFGEPLRRHFDLVGFDPRGVARSNPVDCLSDDQLDVYIASDPDPDDPAERVASDRLLRDFGRGCLRRSGRLARHMSTDEAARDMDVLRAALKQPRMVYFGASYGTFLGATYADLFPGRVGRMVLDGAIDPTVSLVDQALVQSKGFETALRAYARNCVRRGSCFLGSSTEAALERIRSLLDDLDRDPLPLPGGEELTEGHAVLGIWQPLYNRSSWSLLDAGLRGALGGDGRVLRKLADTYVSRGDDGGYLDNSNEAIYTVNCLDRDQGVAPDQVGRYEPRLEKSSPTFGRVFAWGMTACRSWPIHSGRGPRALRAEGSAPILVVGTTRDPATPLSWAEGLVEQLDNARLVRRDGDGHTGYRAGNDCTDDAVEAYLVSGKVPRRTLDC